MQDRSPRHRRAGPLVAWQAIGAAAYAEQQRIGAAPFSQTGSSGPGRWTTHAGLPSRTLAQVAPLSCRHEQRQHFSLPHCQGS